MNVSIRPYVPSDYQACRALWVELTERHREIYDDATIGGDDPGAEFEVHLAKAALLATWVAVKDGGVIGFCSLLSEDGDGEIEPIVVRSAERSRGVGRELLGVAIEEKYSYLDVSHLPTLVPLNWAAVEQEFLERYAELNGI